MATCLRESRLDIGLMLTLVTIGLLLFVAGAEFIWLAFIMYGVALLLCSDGTLDGMLPVVETLQMEDVPPDLDVDKQEPIGVDTDAALPVESHWDDSSSIAVHSIAGRTRLPSLMMVVLGTSYPVCFFLSGHWQVNQFNLAPFFIMGCIFRTVPLFTPRISQDMAVMLLGNTPLLSALSLRLSGTVETFETLGIALIYLSAVCTGTIIFFVDAQLHGTAKSTRVGPIVCWIVGQLMLVPCTVVPVEHFSKLEWLYLVIAALTLGVVLGGLLSMSFRSLIDCIEESCHLRAMQVEAEKQRLELELQIAKHAQRRTSRSPALSSRSGMRHSAQQGSSRSVGALSGFTSVSGSTGSSLSARSRWTSPSVSEASLSTGPSLAFSFGS